MPGLQTGTTLIQLPAWNDLPDDVKKELCSAVAFTTLK